MCSRWTMRLLVVIAGVVGAAAQDAPRPQNAIIFVADGLRHGSVNAADTPALHRVRTQGVSFPNSHSVFPTQTMPNASAIATGHYPGDTGQFANHVFLNFSPFHDGFLGQSPGSSAPDVESAALIAQMNARSGGNFWREASLLAYARSYGFNTAAIGKTGPAAAQDVTEVFARGGALGAPSTIILESATGSSDGIPLSDVAAAMLKSAGMPLAPPPRHQPEGNNSTPGTSEANVEHQQWFADALTKGILPAFARSREPFVVVYWSGDPDQTQHAQGDSLNALEPGINGAASKLAVRNADKNLQQVLDYLDAHPDLRDRTNLFVTSDHGFSTVSRREVDASGRPTASYSATLRYRDASGRHDVNDGHLPPGFLAIDLARAMNLPIFDTEQQIVDESGVRRYLPVDPRIDRATDRIAQHPSDSVALLGGTGRVGPKSDARIVVAQSSIYVPDYDGRLVQRIVAFLAQQDYVGGLFVNDRFGRIPGALRMSDVGLIGTATLPKPAIVVSFKTFSVDPANPTMTSVLVGGKRQHGQGDHGSLARAHTLNNMAAWGPAFKSRFVSHAPVGNTDIHPTIAHILKIRPRGLGRLRGRVLTEALAGTTAVLRATRATARSQASAGGPSTVLMYQRVGDTIYLDEACFTSARECQ